MFIVVYSFACSLLFVSSVLLVCFFLCGCILFVSEGVALQAAPRLPAGGQRVTEVTFGPGALSVFGFGVHKQVQ